MPSQPLSKQPDRRSNPEAGLKLAHQVIKCQESLDDFISRLKVHLKTPPETRYSKPKLEIALEQPDYLSQPSYELSRGTTNKI